jgi:hypothetical protein
LDLVLRKIFKKVFFRKKVLKTSELVLDYLVWVSAGLVPEPELCPGAGAAERSQETL